MKLFKCYVVVLLLVISWKRNSAWVAAEITCPIECHCESVGGHLSLDCSGRELTELPDFSGMEIDLLDISKNLFTEFPNGLSSLTTLEHLDVSGNLIKTISPYSLLGLESLKYLYLNKNNISSWVEINSNSFLTHAVSIQTLSLANNPITSFSSDDAAFLLASKSLKLLDLSGCKISKITGQQIIQGLPMLEHLIFNSNPLRHIPDIESSSLLTLDFSNCRLASIQPTAFSNLPSLSYINFSKNHRLSLLAKSNEYVSSQSVKRLDLSYCNMNAIELQGFPNLMTAILRGNMIRTLTRESFMGNLGLQNLDLSYNSINSVGSGSFRQLRHLKHLDLSFNMIPRIERETFKDNEILSSINLSRNYIGKFNRITAQSLTHLNMSWCEILTIDIDAFNDMPEIIELDLSNNLFSLFPDSLTSETLQTLDLSMCRLSTLQSETFHGFPELSRLSLSGNRFTVPFKSSHFDTNPFLRDIWLGDNPWRCECRANGFQDFFIYLTEYPSRVNDRSHLRCISPEDVFGQAWEVACFSAWYAQDRFMGNAEKIWTILMIAIICASGGICCVMSIKKCIEGRKLEREEEERMRTIEEQREISRNNRIMLEQENQLNAPDPRETMPPCYEDALHMPRIDGSFASLDEIGRRNKRNKDTVNEDDDDEEVITRRNRCRSEEVLSMRDTVNPNPAGDRRSRRRTTRTISVTRISVEPEPPQPPAERDSGLHYHCTDILRLPQRVQDEDDITVFNSREQSPYAQRRVKHMSTFRNDSMPLLASTSSSVPSSAEVEPSTSSGNIEITENYYAEIHPPSSNSDEEFLKISRTELNEISNNNENLKRNNRVDVHAEPRHHSSTINQSSF